jgi:hypothetical protein
VAQCTTLLWCWSLTSVQVRLSPLQGSRVLCRRSSLRWPNGRVLKVQCSQSLAYSGVLALFEVLGTTPNSPPRRDNAVTSEKYSRVGYVPSPPGSPPWRQLSFRTEPCWEKPLTWCPCSSRKNKNKLPNCSQCCRRSRSQCGLVDLIAFASTTISLSLLCPHD